MYHFSSEQISKLKREFHLMEANEGGVIDRDGLAMLLEGIGIMVSEDTLDSLMQEIDVGGDGVIDVVEFEAWEKKRRG